MSENKKVNYVPIKILGIYSVVFYTLWTLFHFFAVPVLDALPNKAVSAFLSQGIIKNLVWTVPAIILIRKYKDKLYINWNEMFDRKKENYKYLLIFPAFFAYIALGIVLHGGSLSISENFGIDNIITVLFVGLTEELVFRGWLLNSTVKRNENVAIAVNALMFLVIHFPRWICEGVFVQNITNLGFVSIVALSVIFSLVFLRTKNILYSIGLHMFWDLIIFMFVFIIFLI